MSINNTGPELPGLNQAHYMNHSLPQVEKQIGEAMSKLAASDESIRDRIIPQVAEPLQRYKVLAGLAGLSQEEYPDLVTDARVVTGEIPAIIIED